MMYFLEEHGAFLWPFLFLSLGYALGAALIAGMMAAQRVKTAMEAGQLSKGVGGVALIISFLLSFGGLAALATSIGTTFREHATTFNSVLMLVALTATVLALSKILVEVGFFNKSDGSAR